MKLGGVTKVKPFLLHQVIRLLSNNIKKSEYTSKKAGERERELR